MRILVLPFLLAIGQGRDVDLGCPFRESVTWDYVRVASLQLSYQQAKFCIYCKDYYPPKPKLKDRSERRCAVFGFDVYHIAVLQNVLHNATSPSGLYAFKCVGGTIRSQLSLKDIAEGEVCESYSFKGNYQTKILGVLSESSFNASTHDSSFYEQDWRSLYMKWQVVCSISLATNALFLLTCIVVVASFHFKRNVRDLWVTGMAIPAFAWEVLRKPFSHVQFQTEDMEGEYTAHDISFRANTLQAIRQNEILDSDTTSLESSLSSSRQYDRGQTQILAIVDEVVTYTVPRDAKA